MRRTRPTTDGEPRATGPISKRTRIAAGVATALVIAGFGASTVVTPADAAPEAVTALRYEQAVSEQTLGDMTLDSLADALSEFGLVVEIAPAGSGATEAGVAPTAEGHDPTGTVDALEGMTDEQIDALSDEEFDALLEDSDSSFDAGDAWDDSESVLGAFSVNGDRLEAGDAPAAIVAEAQEIWERFTALIPADQRQMVVGFELADSDFGGAYVYPSDDDPTKWVLGVGRGMGDDLDFVLIHEFGHLLTLHAGQVPPGGDPDTCSTYYTGEGCALSSSTFSKFVERFWPQDMLDAIARIEESGDWDAADAFYEKYQDSFVTDYATTNPGEDLAETFATFVLQDKPTGDSIADQKVLFLWNDPAMAALRGQIRANMER